MAGEISKTSFITGADNEAIPDERAQHHNGHYTPDNGHSHHRDSIWIGMGIHLPGDPDDIRGSIRKRRSRRKKRSTSTAENQRKLMTQQSQQPADLASMAPGQRVMFLLKEDEDENGVESRESHPALFTEMGELTRIGIEQEWRETARWVKFEEDVEEGGNRWSKPHVASLSLHSLFELRSCLLNGTVIVELEAEDLPQIVDIMLDKMIANNQLEFMYRDEVREVILRRHKHQYEQAKGRDSSFTGSSNQGGFLSAVRSISDIGKTFSHGRNLDRHKPEEKSSGTVLTLPKVGSLPREIGREGSHVDVSKNLDAPIIPTIKVDESVLVEEKRTDVIKGNRKTKLQERMKHITSFPGLALHDVNKLGKRLYPESSTEMGNLHFMKKLPPGAEASNVLIGEVEFLQHHVTAFIRLKTATILGDLTEVPVPTRFMFILLGPTGHSSQYREIGRAIATLMSDEIFHDVAYKARSATDLLDGVDEFLDQVTVLPPGEWDPNIRIEPPTVIPSQEKRKQACGDSAKRPPGGGDDDERGAAPVIEEDERHGSDITLHRTGRLFGGLLQDIKRKLPFYKSDFMDAFNMQCIATFFFMYFALLAPIVTFGGLLEEATHKRMAAMENLFSGCICGVIYHLFSGQPLTILASTGPVLIFETVVYDTCAAMSLNYLSVRLWINIWTAVLLLLIVATDLSSLISYITRFTEESFATLIAVIFIYEAVMKLWKIRSYVDIVSFNPQVENATCSCLPPEIAPTGFDWLPRTMHKMNWNVTEADFIQRNEGGEINGINYSMIRLSQCSPLRGQLEGNSCYPLYDVFLMSLVLMLGTFFLAMTFKGARNSCYFPSWVRQALSDFAVMLAIISMSALDVAVGIDTPKLFVPSTFRPTLEGRGWFIPIIGDNPWWTIPVAIFPALLSCILVFMDQQITAVIVNRKENKLKKSNGYHLDLFVLSLLIIFVGFLGLPVYVAATVLSINHVNSLRVESESRAPGEVAQFVGVREQRVTGLVTFIFIGLSVLITRVLGLIPMPVLYGVFLYMGIAALGGIQLFDRLLLLLMPMKYQPDTMYIRHVPITVIHKFTAFQVACLAVLWVVKSIKKTSIAFPIMLIVMVGVRFFMEKVFSDHDLKYLDQKVPDFHLRKREDLKKKKEAAIKGKDVEEDEKDQPNEESMRHVQTSAHLHIPMASGNVMKIPLSSIQEKEENFNLSKEMNQSGLWKHIASESQASLGRLANNNGRSDSLPPKELAETEDEEPITIKVVKPSPHSSHADIKNSTAQEIQPLLAAKSTDPTSDEIKQESSV